MEHLDLLLLFTLHLLGRAVCERGPHDSWARYPPSLQSLQWPGLRYSMITLEQTWGLGVKPALIEAASPVQLSGCCQLVTDAQPMFVAQTATTFLTVE